MSKPNVGTWADFLIKACALLWFCSVFFIRFGFKREVFLPISLQRCYKIKSEAYQNFLNDITKAECQKNWLQSHITGIGSYFWCRKMSFIITSRVSFTFDIDVKLRTSRVSISVRKKEGWRAKKFTWQTFDGSGVGAKRFHVSQQILSQRISIKLAARHWWIIGSLAVIKDNYRQHCLKCGKLRFILLISP